MTAPDPDIYLTFSQPPGINYLGGEQPMHQNKAGGLVRSDADASHKKKYMRILNTETLPQAGIFM